jgi:tetratricopeptide (TPR) repeat protein
MKKSFLSMPFMLGLLLFTITANSQVQTVSQKKTAELKQMTWSTKSAAAKEIAGRGADHAMNIELPQAYEDFKAALKLDPDFTVALVFMANLTTGETRKAYSEKAVKSAEKKTDGEKLFASLVAPGNTPESNREVWAKLHDMFPDGGMIGLYYIFTRTTPAEQFTAAQDYLKKFPDAAPVYNILAYLYIQEKKDTATAKTYFDKYVQLHPDGCNSYDSMGEYYFMVGDMDNSEKYYKMALEKYPFNSSSSDKLKEIKAIKDKNKTKSPGN